MGPGEEDKQELSAFSQSICVCLYKPMMTSQDGLEWEAGLAVIAFLVLSNSPSITASKYVCVFPSGAH